MIKRFTTIIGLKPTLSNGKLMVMMACSKLVASIRNIASRVRLRHPDRDQHGEFDWDSVRGKR